MKRFAALAAIFWTAFAVRTAYVRFVAPDRTPLPLRKPFSELPMEILGPGWTGRDEPLDADTLRVARVSDYVQRVYSRPGHQVALYVGYVSGRVPDAIHYPGICFPGGGLELEREATVELPRGESIAQPRFREYVWRHPARGGTYTLSSFYYNGKFEPDPGRLMAERVLGVRYFALITLSGSIAGSLDETQEVCREALSRALPRILEHFPLRDAPRGGTAGERG